MTEPTHRPLPAGYRLTSLTAADKRAVLEVDTWAFPSEVDLDEQVQQQTTPASQLPDPTASPTRRPASGHGSPSATTSTSWPRSASKVTIPSVSGVCSSVPNATRTASN